MQIKSNNPNFKGGPNIGGGSIISFFSCVRHFSTLEMVLDQSI